MAAEVIANQYTDESGDRICLGEQLGSGGEGSVYAVTNANGIAAKIYHREMDANRIAKIEALIDLGDEALMAIAAWPTELVRNEAGKTCGFLMPRMKGHLELHELYGPRSRARHFPRADVKFLLAAAANVARAIEVAHRAGCVVGDLNHAAVFVAQNATVRLIDCDSFQIEAKGVLHTCDVGQAMFTPPELQGKALRGLRRDTGHDAFALGVLLFELLFMGRHPFSGRYTGSGEMLIEQAIAERRFAYGTGGASRRMQPPPNTLSLDVYGLELADLFERAFVTIDARPTPVEWIAALNKAKNDLVACGKEIKHAFRPGIGSCPFCEIEENTGAFLFAVSGLHTQESQSVENADRVSQALAVVSRLSIPGATAPNFHGAIAALDRFDNSRHVRRIQGGANPDGLAYSLAGLANVVLAAGLFTTLGSLFAFALADSLGYGPEPPSIAFALGILIALCGGGVRFLTGKAIERIEAHQAAPSPSPPPQQSGLTIERVRALRTEAALLAEKWSNNLRLENQFQVIKNQIPGLRDQFASLPELRRTRIANIDKESRESRLNDYLQRYPIADADIPQIGPSRKATLRSWGILTAGDATPDALRSAPGIGPARARAILEWRNACAVDYVTEKRRAPSEEEIRKIDSLMAADARWIAGELERVVEQLINLRRHIIGERRQIAERTSQIARFAARN